MRVQFVQVVPTPRRRKTELFSCASYSAARMPGLRRPLAIFPAGARPFGRELDHLTDAQRRELRRDA